MAPILSFTAEELWQVFSGQRGRQRLLPALHELPAPAGAEALLARWDRLRELRAPVQKRIEALRAAGKVGSSLQAEVTLALDGADYELLASLGDDLRFVLLTSAARVRGRRASRSIEVAPSAHAKCDRCWHYRADVDDGGLCGRCRGNLDGPGEARTHA
jgi:isoleucyl-tRNA synthetase